MHDLDFLAIEGPTAAAIRDLLADRLLRTNLHGGDADGDAHATAVRWCRPVPRDDRDGVLRQAVRCLSTGEVVGGIALVRRELSFFVAKPFWRQGYGRAMVLRTAQPSTLAVLRTSGMDGYFTVRTD